MVHPELTGCNLGNPLTPAVGHQNNRDISFAAIDAGTDNAGKAPTVQITDGNVRHNQFHSHRLQNLKCRQAGIGLDDSMPRSGQTFTNRSAQHNIAIYD